MSQALRTTCRIGPVLKVVVQQTTKTEEHGIPGLPSHSEPAGWAPVGLVPDTLGNVPCNRSVEVGCFVRQKDPDRESLPQGHGNLREYGVIGTLPDHRDWAGANSRSLDVESSTVGVLEHGDHVDRQVMPE